MTSVPVKGQYPMIPDDELGPNFNFSSARHVVTAGMDIISELLNIVGIVHQQSNILWRTKRLHIVLCLDLVCSTSWKCIAGMHDYYLRHPSHARIQKVLSEGGLWSLFSWWGIGDPKTAINGPPSDRQRNAIEMAFRWRADDGQTLNADLVASWFFRGSGPVLLRNPTILWLFRGKRPPASPLDPYMQAYIVPREHILWKLRSWIPHGKICFWCISTYSRKICKSKLKSIKRLKHELHDMGCNPNIIFMCIGCMFLFCFTFNIS